MRHCSIFALYRQWISIIFETEALLSFHRIILIIRLLHIFSSTDYSILMSVFILFNAGHVPEIVAFYRRMRDGLDDCDGEMVSGNKCGLNFLTFVLQLRENPGKNLNQETDPTGIWTRARSMRGNDVTPQKQRWSLPSYFYFIYTVFSIWNAYLYFYSMELVKCMCVYACVK